MRVRENYCNNSSLISILVHLQFAMIVNGVFGSLINRIIDLHNSCLVTTSVAVIWSGEDSNNGSIVLPLVSFHNQLMSSGDKVKAIDMGKLLGDILSEGVSGSPR